MNNIEALTHGLARMCLRTAVLWPVHGKRFQKKGEATERREARRGGSKTQGYTTASKPSPLAPVFQAGSRQDGTCFWCTSALRSLLCWRSSGTKLSDSFLIGSDSDEAVQH